MKELTFIEEVSDEGYYHVYTNGKYNIGIYPVIYGYRVRVWKDGSYACECDICCGANVATVNSIYNQLALKLKEGTDPSTIPYQQTKPYPHLGDPFTDWMLENWDESLRNPVTEITYRELVKYREHQISHLFTNPKTD